MGDERGKSNQTIGACRVVMNRTCTLPAASKERVSSKVGKRSERKSRAYCDGINTTSGPSAVDVRAVDGAGDVAVDCASREKNGRRQGQLRMNWLRRIGQGAGHYHSPRNLALMPVTSPPSITCGQRCRNRAQNVSRKGRSASQ